MSGIVWTHGYWKQRKGGRAKIWTGNKGADECYEISYRDEYFGVEAPSPKFQAVVKRKRPDGQFWTYFVEPHKRFKTLRAAQDACERHRKETCLFMNTPASAAIPSKNSKKHRDQIVIALRAGSQKDSSDQSAKSASLNLEARLSRSTRGVPARVEGSKLTYDQYCSISRICEGTPTTVAGAMMALGIPTSTVPMADVEATLADMGIIRCSNCAWWAKMDKLRNGLCEDCQD